LKIVRVVFEKGIELCLEEDGLWYFQSGQGKSFVTSPTEVIKKYKVCPILATGKLPSEKEYTFLLSTKANAYLEVGHSELLNKAHAKDLPTLFHSINLSYVVGAVLHHCKSLADIYAEICRTFWLPRPDNPDVILFGNQTKAYYEFEALVTAAIRSYNSTRYIIWEAFGPGTGSVPSSFTKTLPLCRNIPPVLEKRLQLSWHQFGDRVRAYRDCIQHYVPISGIDFNARMVQLERGIWSTSVLIPDNPQARSVEKFRYHSKLDALTYGWQLTNEVLDIAHMIVNQVPDRET
jgi:hypothetical protein